MHKKSNIRIKDIAKMAGVSTGTVDRVIHNRGEVSELSRAAVQKVLDDINYQPNIMARALASKKQYLFACLIPDYEPGEYWQTVELGIDKALEDFGQYNIQIQKITYNQYDEQSFMAASEELIAYQPHAVLIAPIFRSETLRLVSKLQGLKIPFSFLDSMIDNVDFVSYYGQDSKQSGYVAAKLLTASLTASAKLLVVRTKRKGESFSNQTMGRYQGFLQYLHEHHFDNELVKIELMDEDSDNHGNSTALTAVLEQNPGIGAMITFNSKVFKLADFLSERNYKHIVLGGYDLLASNVAHLKNGNIAFLIAQRPEQQSYYAIRDMCHVLIFHREVNAINFMPIDVLMKENIDYYMQFDD